MSTTNMPLRYDFEVPPGGRIEMELPLPAGAQVAVYVVEQTVAEFEDILAASSSSADFWDNPLDDEVWNHA